MPGKKDGQIRLFLCYHVISFPLYFVKRDEAPWKSPVRKHVGQA